MPQLSADEIQGWSQDRLTSEYRARIDRVAGLREAAGGTLTAITDPGDAQEVRNLMADTNLLGDRLDFVRDLGALDADYEAQAGRRLPRDVQAGTPTFPLSSDGAQAGGAPTDLGGRFLASEAWKAFKTEGQRGVTATMPVASLLAGYRGVGEVPNLQAALFQMGSFPSQPDFRPGPVDVLYQANNIGPLMAQGTTNAQTVRYPQETVTATGAATVAEGGAKPEANISFAAVDEPVRKIAVLLPITDEAAEDEGFLRAYLNARLRLFVQNEEDRQLLVGDATATPPQIKGILNRSGINTSTSYSLGGANPDQALIDSVFSASMRVREAFLVPDNVVMRAATWETARLAKDGQRQYLLGPPADAAPQRLWGLNVVLNENMPAKGATNKPVLVGAFQTAAMLIRRSGIDLAIADQHSTFFAENKLMLRAEERVAMAVFRPAAFATVTSAA